MSKKCKNLRVGFKKTLNLVPKLSSDHPCIPVNLSMALAVGSKGLLAASRAKNNRKRKIITVLNETIKAKLNYLPCNSEQKKVNSLAHLQN